MSGKKTLQRWWKKGEFPEPAKINLHMYQVYKVESKFDNGQFLQTLFCVRMNNQQGQGSAPRVLSSQSGAYTDASAETEIEKIKKKKALIEKRKSDQDEFDLLFGG